MKQLLSILLIFITFSGAAFAQDPERKKADQGERIEALKIAFITRKLNLTPDEAQKFWPVYNKYSAELKKLFQEARRNETPEIETEEKLLNLRKKYNAEFSKVLPAEKVNTYFKAEKEFGSMLKKEWQERREKRMGKKQPD